MLDYQTYYASIVKPFFAPEPWVFGVAWGIIYPLIALAGLYLLILWWRRSVPLYLVFVFAANLAANLAFTPLQLGMPETILPTLDILVVLGTLAYFEYRILRYSRVIFWLLVPYLLWGTFATVLQLSILFLN
ncbi:MAG: TspO/MBR family protein [bacterium]|nr:TspO/MBR family protein [bacterium]